MSAALAIPATTLVLKRLLDEAIGAAYGGGFPPTVSIGAPPRPPMPAAAAQPEQPPPAEPAGLNMYMHHASPNPGWTALYEPRQDSAGNDLNNGPLVLDLHYLLSAHGSGLEREILLGIGMHALHRAGIVRRKRIKQLLNPPAVVPDGIVDQVPTHPLWAQFEQITVSRETLDTDTLTKIWTALQVPYRPSLSYLVTTVFLEEPLDVAERVPVEEVVLMAGTTSLAAGKVDELIALEKNRLAAEAGQPPVAEVVPVEIDTIRIDKAPGE